MKTACWCIGTLLVVELGWLGGLASAQQARPVLPGNPAVSVPTAQDVQAPDPMQTIRIEPVDATHVRLRLDGREDWVVDSAGFSLLLSSDVLRVIAVPGTSTIDTLGTPHPAETFELSVAPSGALGFRIRAERR